MAERPLTAKDRLFIAYYLDHLDPSKAAIQAGYSETIAKTKAYSWVSNGKIKPKIHNAVKDALDLRLRRLGITSDRVATELEKMAFVNGADFFDDNGKLIHPNKLPRDVAATISEVKERRTSDDSGNEHVEITYKTESKKASLELLGKHLSMFTDKKEVIIRDKTESDYTDEELITELEKYGIKPPNSQPPVRAKDPGGED